MKRRKYKGRYRKHIYITQAHEDKALQEILDICNNTILTYIPALAGFLDGNSLGTLSQGLYSQHVIN